MEGNEGDYLEVTKENIRRVLMGNIWRVLRGLFGRY